MSSPEDGSLSQERNDRLDVLEPAVAAAVTPAVAAQSASSSSRSLSPSQPRDINLFAAAAAPPPLVTSTLPPVPARAAIASRSGGEHFGQDVILSGTVIVPGSTVQPSVAAGNAGLRRYYEDTEMTSVSDQNAFNAATTTTTTVFVPGGPTGMTALEEEHQQQQQQTTEWDIITQTTSQSHRMRILWIFEFIVCIVSANSFPYFWMVVIFPFIGYYGARWWKYWAVCAGIMCPLMAIPLTLADVITRIHSNDTMDGVEQAVVIVISIAAVCYHGWVAYHDWMLARMVQPLTVEQFRQLDEMPPVCGCI